jgi:hypothetical protein
MNLDATGPQVSSEPPPHACPHCGAGGCGGAPDPAAENLEILSRINKVGAAILESMGRQHAAAGGFSHQEAVTYEIVSRATQRGVLLRERMVAESKRTREERAADRARRAEAAERAKLHDKRDKVRRGVKRQIEGDKARPNRENLLADLNDRLLDPDIDVALTQQDIFKIVLGICKDLGVTPKNEYWSDAMLTHEIFAAEAEIARYEAERAAGIAAQAAGADWREGIEYGPGTGPPDPPDSG